MSKYKTGRERCLLAHKADEDTTVPVNTHMAHQLRASVEQQDRDYVSWLTGGWDHYHGGAMRWEEAFGSNPSGHDKSLEQMGMREESILLKVPYDRLA